LEGSRHSAEEWAHHGQQVAQLPGVRWKLHNLEQLAKASPEKFAAQANGLERLLLTDTN
jgi:hypothetical protein